MWLVQGSRRHSSGWDPAAAKEKAQQESTALMLPTPAVWEGLLDSSPAIVSWDFGPSLALALAQLSISMARPHSQAVMLAVRQGAFLQSLPGISLWDRHTSIPHAVEQSQLLPYLPPPAQKLAEAHPSSAWLSWTLAESPWVLLFGHTPVHTKTMLFISHGITLSVP